jgi:hypothetical protein
MPNRREFLQEGTGALTTARLIGPTLAPGMFLPRGAAVLKGPAASVVIPTHERYGDNCCL